MSTNASSSDSTQPRPDYADVSPTALVQVGFIFRPHGMDGELKIDPSSTDDPTRFEDLPVVFVGAHPHRVARHAVASVRYQQTKRGVSVILGLEGIDDRDDSEAVAKMKVFATEEALGLEEGELFAHELVGWTVVTEEGSTLGTVANLMEMPAQDMFVVRTPDDEQKMLPAVEDFILAFDEEEERIVVRPIEGLMDG
ncbi:MAG: ribosome maturation factor RimM [Salinibacter sp.]